MLNKPEISFIIVNYKSHFYTKKCISSILKNSQTISNEIIIVNNDPSSFHHNDSKIKIINHNKNIGFAKANNMGAKKARGRYLCIINPDTQFIKGDIKLIINKFKKNKEIGAIGPKILDKNKKDQIWSTGVETNFWDIIRNNFGFPKSKKIWRSQKPIFVDWITGACMFIRSDLFEKIGGFDENFFMYFEDMDLCKRVRSKGKKILYFPSLKIKHLGGKSTNSKKKQKAIYHDSLSYYAQKHLTKPSSFLINLIRKLFFDI